MQSTAEIRILANKIRRECGSNVGCEGQAGL